jgi:hypothetical protein
VTTRRELLMLAAAAPLVAAVPARAANRDQATLLAEGLRLEQACADFYTGASALAMAARFAAHEADQAAALETSLEAMGSRALERAQPGELVPGPPGSGAPQAELAAYAIRLEEATIDAHDALLRVTDEALLIGSLLSVMAAAGTHLAVLRPIAATL